MSAVRSVLDGVAENVHHHLFQAAPVAGDEGQIALRHVGQFMATLLGVKAVGADYAFDSVMEGEPGEHHFGAAGVQPAEGQQILNDVGHAVRFRNDDIQEIVFHLPGDVIPGVPDGFGVTADVGQGGPQFVRHVGYELLAPFLVPVLLRHVMEQDQHAALGLVGEGREVEGQGPVSHHQLIFNVVGFLEGQHVLERMQIPQQLLIGAAWVDGAPQKLCGGGIAVDEVSFPIEGHHAVGHVEEQGVQFVALVFHGGQRGLQDLGHLVKCSGENANLVGGFHRQLAVKITGGHSLRADGQFFNGANHGLGEQKAQQYGDQQTDDKGLHDDLEKLIVQVGYCVLVIKDIDDESIVAAEDGDGHIHVVGGDITFIAYGGGVLPCNRVPGGQKVGGLLPR